MSIRFNGVAGQRVWFDPAVVPAWTSHTVMFWARLRSDRNAISSFWAFEDSSPAWNYNGLITTEDGTSLRLYANATNYEFGVQLVVDRWYFMAFRQQGTGAGAVKGFLLDSVTNTWTTLTAAGGSIGAGNADYFHFGDNQWSEPLDGEIGNIVVGDGSWTDAEIQAQAQSYSPIQAATTSIWVPADASTVAAAVRDVTGNGRHGTAAGTPTLGAQPPATLVPRLLLSSDFQAPVTLTAGTNTGNRDQYLRGGPWGTVTNGDPEYPNGSPRLWGSPDINCGYILSIVGPGTSPVSDYALASLKSAPDHLGATRQVLSLHVKQDSPNTAVEQIVFQNTNMAVEPIFYQKMWLWVDPGIATRMAALSPGDRWAIVWEMKAQPDYRMRIQLLYDAAQSRCYWHTQGDVLANANPLWEASSQGSFYARPGGWHLIELYLNRAAPRWRVSIDGQPLIDRTTGSLMGASQSKIDLLMFVNAYGVSGTPPGGAMIGGEYRISQMQLWDAIPAGAFESLYSFDGAFQSGAFESPEVPVGQLLDGSSTASVTASGSLTANARFAASPALSLTASGALRASARLSGGASLSATSAGALTASIRLTGGVTASVAASGELAVSGAMSASASAGITASGSLTAGTRFVAPSSGYAPHNLVPNSRANGLAGGSPGTVPTGWVVSGGALTGLTRTLSAVTLGGNPGVSIRLAGTSTNGGALNVVFADGIAIGSQPATRAVTWRLAAGTLAGVTNQSLLGDHSNAGGYAGTQGGLIAAPTATAVRVSNSGTFPAGTLATNIYLNLSINAGAAVDFTIEVAAPQTNLGLSLLDYIATDSGALGPTTFFPPAGVASATGSLTGSTRFSGSATGSVAASANLLARALLAGSSVGSLTASGELSIIGGFSASVAVQAILAGNLTTFVRMSGAAAAGVTASGQLATSIRLTGAASASLTSSSQLRAAARFAGTATLSVGATAALTAAARLAGASTASAVASGQLLARAVLSGASAASVGASASLFTRTLFVGQATASATAFAQQLASALRQAQSIEDIQIRALVVEAAMTAFATDIAAQASATDITMSAIVTYPTVELN